MESDQTIDLYTCGFRDGLRACEAYAEELLRELGAFRSEENLNEWVVDQVKKARHRQYDGTTI